MMQLLCNGVFLDMPDSWSLAFKRSNVLFAFDKIACERTLSFDIPATPKNEQVFGLAKLPENNGAGMRVKFPCQLQADAVVMDGVLHVESYDGAYKGVFVTGDLMGLQAIRDAGNLADLHQWTNWLKVDNYTHPPYSTRTSMWAQTKYKGVPISHASMRLQQLIADACNAIGVTPPTLPEAAQYVRIIPPKMFALQESAIVVTQVVTTNPTPSGVQVSQIDTNVLSEYFEKTANRQAVLQVIENVSTEPVSINYRGYVQHLKCINDITLNFPSDFPSDVFVGYFDTAATTIGFTFLGDYSFTQDASKTINGDSLAGRSVDLPAGAEFCFVKYTDFKYESDVPADTETIGWLLATGSTAYNLTMQGTTEEVTLGQIVRLQDCLPDITLVCLLKVVAAITGTALYYDQNGISFDTLDIASWPVLRVENVIKVTDIRRTFGEFQQHNYVAFEPDAAVMSSERLRLDYAINNQNIGAANDLQVIPFSEGTRAGDYDGRQYVAISDDERWALGDAELNAGALLRVGLPIVSTIAALCAKSTRVTLTARMTMQDYNRVTPKTLLQVGGVRYVWTDAQWQKDMAKFTLSAI